MSSDIPYSEEHLAGLLRLLPPPPADWVRAAAELPRARRELEQIVALAETDAAFRRELIADLDAALERAGLEPAPRLVRELRTRLPEGNA
jgi:hypothetical protein